jgi:RNA polymerase sigma factor for flagellar operon FliA
LIVESKAAYLFLSLLQAGVAASVISRLGDLDPTEVLALPVGEVGEYHDFLDQYSRVQVASLEARLEVDGKPGIEYEALLEDSAAVDPQSQANLEDLRVQLIDAIGQLEERERLVATFYFYEGLTLKEIAKALALTEGRVSQILHRALAKLRWQLKGSLLAYEVGNWQAFG